MSDSTESDVRFSDGHITETGTYRQLIHKEGSRFRSLMAAQLTAPTGEMPVLAPANSVSKDSHSDTELPSEPPRRPLPSPHAPPTL